MLYTDYFLARSIELLRKNDETFETALLYVSDHGESLGENGIYLHGMPKLVAPAAQLHVPAVLWLGKQFEDIDSDKLRARSGQSYSHANLPHTILGLMEIESEAYRPELDILSCCRLAEAEHREKNRSQ